MSIHDDLSQPFLGVSSLDLGPITLVHRPLFLFSGSALLLVLWQIFNQLLDYARQLLLHRIEVRIFMLRSFVHIERSVDFDLQCMAVVVRGAVGFSYEATSIRPVARHFEPSVLQ